MNHQLYSTSVLENRRWKKADVCLIISVWKEEPTTTGFRAAERTVTKSVEVNRTW